MFVKNFNKKGMLYQRSTQGWREINNNRFYFRSSWEANYARYLQLLKDSNQIVSWEYESKTFWFESIKRGVRSYKPDFKINELNGNYFWVEVKGFFDSKSLTKIKRFRKYYPEEKLILIDKNWFKANAPKLKMVIKDWESPSSQPSLSYSILRMLNP